MTILSLLMTFTDLHVFAPTENLLKCIISLSELTFLRSMITSPAVAVSKYSDEHVCLSVRHDISGITHAIFTDFSVHIAYMAVAITSGIGPHSSYSTNLSYVTRSLLPILYVL